MKKKKHTPKYRDIIGYDLKAYVGYRGDLVINKVIDINGHIYGLIKPIVQKNKTIYAIYDKQEELCGFDTNAKHGFHFEGTDDIGNRDLKIICTGEMVYSYKTEIKEGRKLCEEVARNFSLINLGSLPEFWPDTEKRYPGLSDAIKDLKDYDIVDEDYFKRLL